MNPLKMAGSLRICSWNSRGHAADRLAHVDELMQCCDVLLVQEHWLFDFELHKLTTNSAFDLAVYGVSGMDAHKPLVGRPFGGCAIIHKTELRCTVTPICVDSRRLFACIIDIPECCKLIVCNVYMPCDLMNTSEDVIYREILNEIESVINSHHDVDYVLIGGDMNTDVSRTRSGHSLLLKEFCDSLGLRLCLSSPNSSIDFTYYNEASGSHSILDHFIVSENLFHSIESYSCLHRGDNLSDHVPVCLRLNLSVCYLSQPPESHAPRPSWARVTAEQIAAYRHHIRDSLSDIHVPFEVFACNMFECEDVEHRNKIDEYYLALVEAIISATRSCVPTCRKKDKAGWSVHVKESQKEAIFWNRIWLASGRPNTGWVYEIRRRTRANYKRLARWCTRNQESLSAERMAHALSSNNSRDLWSEVKRVKGNSHMHASKVDGAEGVSDVCDVFRDKYESLYSSVSYNEDDMNVFIDEVSSRVRHCKTGLCINHHSLNVNDVKEAVHKLKHGKSDVNTMLSSDNFIYACSDLFIHLSFLLNMMFSHSVVSNEMLLSILVPIPKNRKKSLYDSNNYRSIAISSIIGKIMDNVILSKHANVLQTSDLQFGFKPQHSTTQCTYVVREVVDYYVNNRSPVFVTLLDASRAFDRVHYVKLFRLLLKRNMCPSLIMLLISMYVKQSLVVRWQNELSHQFHCKNGIKQGGVLSPVLFCVYMDELISRLVRLNVGCHLGHKYTGVLTYADDVTLLAPTYEATMEMLKVCEDCAKEYDILFNSTKSQVLFFPTPATRKLKPVVKLNNEVVEYTNRALHLGSYIGVASDRANVEKAVNDLYIRANFLSSYFRFTSVRVMCNLFNSYCSSFFGSPLWNLNAIEPLCIAYRKCIRKILCLPPRTHSRFVPFFISKPDLQTQLLIRFVKFWHKSNASNNEVVSLCCSVSAQPSSTSVIAKNVKCVLDKLQTVDFSSLTVNMLTSKLLDCFSNSLSEDDVLSCNTIIELLGIRNNEIDSPLSYLEIEAMIRELCTT